jgi:nicotinamidase-related amidase
MSDDLHLTLRRQALVERDGYVVWETRETPVVWPAARTALVLCDVWDRHTCRGAEERLARLLPRMNDVVRALRARGGLIAHAPSDTIPNYAGVPARERVLDVPVVEPPPGLEYEDLTLPVDATGGGCDTCPDEQHPKYERGMPYPWTREHPAIEIDQERDVISADGRELYSYYAHRGIEHVLIAGVHTNMCILNRTFAIKQMARWGMPLTLVRDLTDTMYNPSRPPYVSHEEGTRLVVEFVEKYGALVETARGVTLRDGGPATVASEALLG